MKNLLNKCYMATSNNAIASKKYTEYSHENVTKSW